VAHSYGGVVTASIVSPVGIGTEYVYVMGSASVGQPQEKRLAPTEEHLSDGRDLRQRVGRGLPRRGGVRVRNWICSKAPLDEEVMGGGWRVSAGTRVHEESSHSALHSVIHRIEECFDGEDE